jgi:hypothetical protein
VPEGTDISQNTLLWYLVQFLLSFVQNLTINNPRKLPFFALHFLLVISKENNAAKQQVLMAIF